MMRAGAYNGSSFFDYLQADHSHLLPSIYSLGEAVPPAHIVAPEGTTVMALKHSKGLIMLGDRMAVEGFQVSSRKIDKVYKADDHSVIAIAGTAGPCLDMVKLFQTELQHYEKIEGEELVLEGKANKLAQMVGMNFSKAMYGLMVIPIYGGYDASKGEGRIFKYDITGGRYEEEEYYAAGSGGKDARSSLKRFFRTGLSEDEAVIVGLEALLDASEEDLGTGGPDLIRGILPTIKTITAEGVRDLPEAKIQEYCETIIENKRK